MVALLSGGKHMSMTRWLLRAGRLACCAVIATVFAVTLASWLAEPKFDDALLRYSPPHIPKAYQRTITLRGKGGEPYWRGDGREVYLSQHYSGWNDCRFVFALDKPFWRYDPHDPAVWCVDAPMEVNDAREDGWRVCSSQLDELLTSTEEDLLRSRVLNWRRREALVIGLSSFLALTLLLLGTATFGYFRVSLAVVFLTWVLLVIVSRGAHDATLDGPLAPLPALVGFILCVALVICLATKLDNSLRHRQTQPNGRHD